MLEFRDLPYNFVPPKPSPILISLAQLVIGKIALPGKRHLIEDLEIRGQEAFRQSCGKDAPLLLLPSLALFCSGPLDGRLARPQ